MSFKDQLTKSHNLLWWPFLNLDHHQNYKFWGRLLVLKLLYHNRLITDGQQYTTIFNNISHISWHSVLLVEETRLHRENHRPVASHWQTLSHTVVSSTPHFQVWFEITTLVVIDTDCTGSYESNHDYHGPKFWGRLPVLQ